MTKIKLIKTDNYVDRLELTKADGSIFKAEAVGLGEDTILRFSVEEQLDLEAPFRSLAKSLDSNSYKGTDTDLKVDAMAKAFKDHTASTPTSVFFQTITMICANLGVKWMPITRIQVDAIRFRADPLLKTWAGLKPGQNMELSMPLVPKK